MMQKTWIMTEPWNMGTHLRVLGESYPMKTNMTRLRWFQKCLCPCASDESSLSIGRVKSMNSEWQQCTPWSAVSEVNPCTPQINTTQLENQATYIWGLHMACQFVISHATRVNMQWGLCSYDSFQVLGTLIFIWYYILTWGEMGGGGGGGRLRESNSTLKLWKNIWKGAISNYYHHHYY